MHLCATLGHALSSMFHQSQTSSVAAMLCTASFRLPSLAQTMHTVWPEVCGHPICVLCVWGWFSWFGLWQQFGEEAEECTRIPQNERAKYVAFPFPLELHIEA